MTLSNEIYYNLLKSVVNYFDNRFSDEYRIKQQQKIITDNNMLENRGAIFHSFLKKTKKISKNDCNITSNLYITSNGYFNLHNENEQDISLLIKALNKILTNNELVEFTLVSDYAKNHDTHNNSKLDMIRPKNAYLFFKYNISQEIGEGIVITPDSIKGFNKNKSSKRLIITENQYIYDQSISEWNYYLEQHGITYDNESILFGQGNNINSKKYIEFLHNFDEILYFGDIDDAGYHIFLNLEKSFNNKIEYIVPSIKKFFVAQKELHHYLKDIKGIKNTTHKSYIQYDSKLYNFLEEKYQFKTTYNHIFKMFQEQFVSF